MNDRPDPPRLYLLTPRIVDAPPLVEPLTEILDAAAIACVRLRLTTADAAAAQRATDLLRPICHERETPLVLEGDWRVALEAGLDGVHLGHGGHEQEAALEGLRAAIGAAAIVGVDGRASRHLGIVAAERGADYVSFGPVSSGGPDEEVADRDLFAWWQEMIETPVVAEGGATPEIAATLVGAADFIGVSEGVWDHPEGAAAGIRAFAAAI